MKRPMICLGFLALALPAPALGSNKTKLERAVMEQDAYTHPARPKHCQFRESIGWHGRVITRHCEPATERRRAVA